MKARDLHRKRQAIAGKSVLGVDPGKQKHSAAIVDPSGQQFGGAFTFPVTREGFDEVLWKHIGKRLGDLGPESLVVAIETSCNLWLTLAHYFDQKGYKVLLVSPLTTRHARPVLHHDFSKSDPRDAFVVADCGQKGCYHDFLTFAPHLEAAHQLSIAYDKLLKDRNRAVLRLRSLMERVFPEFLGAFDIQTQTSLYLLERYFLPEHFRHIDVQAEGAEIKRISRGSHGPATIERLKTWAGTTIGVPVDGQEEALRIVLDGWIDAIRGIQRQIGAVEAKMIELTRNEPTFRIVDSIPNIDKNLAARFTAETRGAGRFTHFKQIEKLAGSNVRICDSGKYKGKRRMSKVGNPRLRRIIYQMTELTARVVPKVRRRFLECEIKKKCYRKSIVSASSQLLMLVLALLKENRPYEDRPDQAAALKPLQKRYETLYKKRRAA